MEYRKVIFIEEVSYVQILKFKQIYFNAWYLNGMGSKVMWYLNQTGKESVKAWKIFMKKYKKSNTLHTLVSSTAGNCADCFRLSLHQIN